MLYVYVCMYMCFYVYMFACVNVCVCMCRSTCVRRSENIFLYCSHFIFHDRVSP